MGNIEEACILGTDFLEDFKTNINMETRQMDYCYEGKKETVKLTNESPEALKRILNIKKKSVMEVDLNHLEEKDQNTIREILIENADMFTETILELGCSTLPPQKIITTGEPFAFPAYRCPVNLRPFLKEYIDSMLKADIIEKSTSPYSSPVFLVPKPKPGEYRFVVDMRHLNAQTVRDKFPIPRVDDTLDLLGAGAKYFTTLDLTSGYYQVAIEEDCRFKTAFATYYGHFQFKRMVMGCQGSPPHFQRCMHEVLRDVLYDCVLIYLDDVIIFSKTLHQHAKDIRKVLGILRGAKLQAKLSKCLFAMLKVLYLAHEIEEGGINPDTKKLEAVKKYPRPTNAGQVKSYLGLLSYFRRFIPNFGSTAHSLYMLTRVGAPFQWGETEEFAFTCLRDKLISTPILRLPDFTRASYILHTDSSNYGLGIMLSQMQPRRKPDDGARKPTGSKKQKEEKEEKEATEDNGEEEGRESKEKMNEEKGIENEEEQGREEIENDEEEVVIAYASRHLTDTETRYSVTEKECLAIVHAFKTFNHYLYGSHVIVYCDHRPLSTLMKKKDPTGRLHRWATYLQQYDIEIRYKPGKENVVADALSRAPVNVIRRNFIVDDWIKAQKEDEYCKTVLNQIVQDPEIAATPTTSDGDHNEFHILENGLIADPSGRILVPKALRESLLFDYHDHKLGGHLGIMKTYANLKHKYVWPNMRSGVTSYIAGCEVCAKRKTHRLNRAPLQPIPVAEYVFQRIVMDCVGPLPVTYSGRVHIFIMIDCLTKYAIAVATRDVTAKTIARKFIKHFILPEGLPEEIITDRASYFQSELMHHLCKQLGVKMLRGTSFHSQTQGQVERLNRIIVDMLSALEKKRPS